MAPDDLLATRQPDVGVGGFYPSVQAHEEFEDAAELSRLGLDALLSQPTAGHSPWRPSVTD